MRLTYTSIWVVDRGAIGVALVAPVAVARRGVDLAACLEALRVLTSDARGRFAPVYLGQHRFQLFLILCTYFQISSYLSSRLCLLRRRVLSSFCEKATATFQQNSKFNHGPTSQTEMAIGQLTLLFSSHAFLGLVMAT